MQEREVGSVQSRATNKDFSFFVLLNALLEISLMLFVSKAQQIGSGRKRMRKKGDGKGERREIGTPAR